VKRAAEFATCHRSLDPSGSIRRCGNVEGAGLDTTTPAGKAMFQMMGVFAEFERAMIQERVRAGLARARSEGNSRPRLAI
jgi:DNA invertase Pin-like site-specific DNA recombinase